MTSNLELSADELRDVLSSVEHYKKCLSNAVTYWIFRLVVSALLPATASTSPKIVERYQNGFINPLVLVLAIVIWLSLSLWVFYKRLTYIYQFEVSYRTLPYNKHLENERFKPNDDLNLYFYYIPIIEPFLLLGLSRRLYYFLKPLGVNNIYSKKQIALITQRVVDLQSNESNKNLLPKHIV